ncbi:ATP-binding protein [bacterium]|nr:ATP-binding protein [bacterium]
MRIYNISNNVNFGYNKDLNDKVRARLQQDASEDESNLELLKLNDICNNAEDKLREAAKTSDWNLEGKYLNIYARLKSFVTETFEYKYPDLHYRKTELETYKKEYSQIDQNDASRYHWMDAVIDTLEFNEEFGDPDSEAEAEATPSSEKSPSKTDFDKDAVEKFVPGAFSPKGFESIEGMDELKDILIDRIVAPLGDTELAKLDEEEYGQKAPRGFLLYGPPGCGKTYITQALAMETGLPMFKPRVINRGPAMYVNGASANLKEAYNCIKQYAKDNDTPVIMFIDEVDAIAQDRTNGANDSPENNKLVTELLQVLDQAREDNIIVIAATNKIMLLDDAVRSRLEKIEIPLPDVKTRQGVLAMNLSAGSKGKALAQDKEALKQLANLTKGFSNRDLSMIIDSAFSIAKKDGRRDVRKEDVIRAIDKSNIIPVDERYYRNEKPRSVGFRK